jgi:hypothetical protein
MRSSLLLRQGSPETTLADPQESMQTLQDCLRPEIRTVSINFAFALIQIVLK